MIEEGTRSGECLDDDVLLSYRAGKLDAAETARAEAHLAGCGECRAVLEELSRPEAVELGRRVRLELARTAPFTARRKRIIVGLTAAAAIAGAILLMPWRRPAPAAIEGVRIEGPDGAIVGLRSSTTAPSEEEKRFDANSRIVFRVTWDRAKSGDAVDISIFELGEDGALRRLEHATADAVPLGGVRLTVPAEANLGSRPRDVVLYLAVLPGSSAPAIAGLTPEEAERRLPGAQLKKLRLRYEGRSDP